MASHQTSPSYASNGHHNIPADDPEFEDYEQMGRDLLQSMKQYGSYLRKEGGTMPSLSPRTMANQGASPSGEAARTRVVELAQQILATTMDPGMNLMINSLSVAVDLCIAEKIPRHGQVQLHELAEATGAQERLLVRVMRILTSKYVFAEPQPGIYSHTAMSWTMTGSNQRCLLTHRLEDGFRSASREADALRLSGYREPEMGDKYGFNLAFDSDATFWEYITEKDPKRGENFNTAMKAVNLNNLSGIPTLYPFDKLSEHGGLIIDVGGGLGQAGLSILANYPDSNLRCIVQDQFAPAAKTISQTVNKRNGSSIDVEVTLQQHNFFHPQPNKGAAAYFFRHIFHDWPDSACRDILRQIVPAMDKQHSCILICDQVMHESSTSIPSLLYDMAMMSMLGGKERKLSEWKVLIAEADERLHITDVKKSPSSATTILEVRLQ